MYNQAKLNSLRELRAMLDKESLGRLDKPAAPQLPGEMPPQVAAEEMPPPVEQEDDAQLQALLEAYGQEDEEMALGQAPVPLTGVN